MKLEDPNGRWLFTAAHNITKEELVAAMSAISRFMLVPPRPTDEARRATIRTALAHLKGSQSARVKLLAHNYTAYLTNGWPREQELEELPEPGSAERVLLHRIAKLNDGKPLGARRIFDIAFVPKDPALFPKMLEITECA